jgi:hypothetical protein
MIEVIGGLHLGVFPIILLGTPIGAVSTWLASLPRESANVPYGFPEGGPSPLASVDSLVLGATLGTLFGAVLAAVLA